MSRPLAPAAALAAALLSVTPAAPFRAQVAPAPDVGFVKGDPTAPVTVVEYGDFGCAACAMFALETLPALEAEFIRTGRVRWRFVPTVLGTFRHSARAAKAAFCAGQQDRFWPMHDRLFARQAEWMRVRDPEAVFRAFADALNLDAVAFSACYREGSTNDRVKRWRRFARSSGIRATPTFLIGDRRAYGALSIQQFRTLVTEALTP